MVAYSFQKRFAPLIVTGHKHQTIRAERKPMGRHARVGEQLQLFVGMRTKHCRKIIPDVICTAVLPIMIEFDDGHIARIEVGGVRVIDLDRFAGADGFADRWDMQNFWAAQHSRVSIFKGALIEWAPPLPLAVPA